MPARIREWLKTLRKKNVAVVFATQSLADIERSSIAPALIESCPTRIFLPNDRALEPQARSVYERFGLNDRQIEILSLAAPKRDYYAQTARGNRLFELGLGPVALALVRRRLARRSAPRSTAASPTAMPPGFAARFLDAKGLGWAAELIGALDPPTAPAKPSKVPSEPPSTRSAVRKPAPTRCRRTAIREPSSGALQGGTPPPQHRAAVSTGPEPQTGLATAASGRRLMPLPGLPGGPPLSERLLAVSHRHQLKPTGGTPETRPPLRQRLALGLPLIASR